MRRFFARSLVVAIVLLAIAQPFARSSALAQAIHADSGDALAGQGFASDPAGAVERARKSVAGGDLSGAIATLALYVAAHPREPDPARYLGDLYYRKGDLGASERTYRAVLAILPGDAQTHDRLGGIYAAEDRVVDAIAQFQRSLPESSAYGHLVELHRRLGDLAGFEHQIRAQADADASDAAAAYAMGTILNAEHRPAEAIPYLERALLASGTSCPALSELGVAYADVGRGAEGERTIERCLSYDPDNYPANVFIGTVFVAEGKIAQARASFERANRVRPEGPEALVDLGYIEDLDRHWDAAVGLYLRAIALDPLARDAYVDLGCDYRDHRLFALAESAYLKGLSISPDDGRLHYLLAVAYVDQGKRDLARAEYRAATRSDEPEVALAASHDLSELP
jgi:tetratricopeptide (TPR) repeat protein